MMGHRIETMDRELSNAVNSMKDRQGPLKDAQQASMMGIAYMQLFGVDLPTWYGAYAKGTKQFTDEMNPENFENYAKFSEAVEERAIVYADFVVETFQGSSAIKDMSLIMRDNGALTKATTMFMSYFSGMYNVQRDLLRGAKSGQYSPIEVASKMFFIYAIPVFFDTLIGYDWDDEDESFLMNYGVDLATYPFQVFPVIRSVVNAATTGFDFEASPIIPMVSKGTKGASNIIEDIVTGGDISSYDVKNVGKLAGALLGVPGVSQAFISGTHLYDVLEEGEDFSLFNKFLF
jgi:hypothetical protein